MTSLLEIKGHSSAETRPHSKVVACIDEYLPITAAGFLRYAVNRRLGDQTWAELMDCHVQRKYPSLPIHPANPAALICQPGKFCPRPSQPPNSPSFFSLCRGLFAVHSWLDVLLRDTSISEPQNRTREPANCSVNCACLLLSTSGVYSF